MTNVERTYIYAYHNEGELGIEIDSTNPNYTQLLTMIELTCDDRRHDDSLEPFINNNKIDRIYEFNDGDRLKEIATQLNLTTDWFRI